MSKERESMAKDKSTGSTSIYAPAGFYLLRAPVLSTDVFMQMLAGSNDMKKSTDLDTWVTATSQQTYSVLRGLTADLVIEQALAVASTDILKGLAYIRQGDTSRRSEHAYSGVLRYLVRMSTRPTPFGLFSGVAVGTLGEKTTVQMGTPTVQDIRTRPDMGWLLSIIQHIEEDKVLIPQLNVVVNSTVYVAGARAVLPYADVYGKGDNRSIALRATPVVRYVMERAQKPVPYNQLRQDLLETFSHATEQQVDSLLQQLWNLHFLVSDLRPPLTSANPEQYLLEHLGRIPGAAGLTAALEEVTEIAELIEQAGMGGSTFLLHRLKERQKFLVNDYSHQTYQMDASLHLETPQLNREIGEAVADATEVLIRMTRSSQGVHHLREYYMAFVERYGMEAEVPLLDLLSPEFGLDAPSGYLEPQRSFRLQPLPLPNTQARDSILSSLLADALYHQAQEIELTDDIVQKLTQWAPGPESLPPPAAMEMYLQIHAASPEAIDQGEWRGVVAPACLSVGGRTFCRFFDILGEKGLQLLQEYTRKEEELFPDIIFAELSYMPTLGRGANVTIRPALRSYEIVVNTMPSVPPERVLPLNDLVVGVKGERFYIRSLRLGRKVVVTQSHMLNIMHAPNICRFLLEASHDSNPAYSPFDWGAAAKAVFLPRVVRKKIVLSPARWNLQSSMIELIGQGSHEARFFRGVQQWREQWRVPRYVYLAQFDNRLLLDLEHPLTIAELRDALKKVGEHTPVALQEMLPDFEHLWLRDCKQRPYITELVIPLLVKEQAIFKPSEQAKQKLYPQRAIPDKERRKQPGEDWTFLKIYVGYKQHDEIISGPLRAIAKMLSEQKLIDDWFFIRYADPEPHLRIRFHATNEQTRSNVLINTLNWSRELVRRDLINKVVVDAYDREIERYGGPDAIDAIEQVFSINSVATSELVAALYKGEISLDPLAVAVFTLDQFFELWGLDFASRLEYIQSHTKKYEGSEAFRSQRQLYCELLQPWDPDYDQSIQVQREKLRQLCALQGPILQKVGAHIRGLAVREALWLPEQQILRSLAHMHINRLLGANREQEQNAYAFWRQTLESLRKRPAQKGSKKVPQEKEQIINYA
jgi:lantibiotic biosynthesis protein